MTGTINYREFYQRAPILISEKDRVAFQKEESYADVYTHWLIALEGNEINQNVIQWRVVIFPTCTKGHFNCKFPFFQSPFLQTFDEAFELTKKIEMLAKQDQLTTIKN